MNERDEDYSSSGNTAMTNLSLLDYYRTNRINPVPIPVEERAAWESHFAKRRNLYERHLGIPFCLLRGKSAIEFGCNSGENALVLATLGMELTLLEPNEQVIPRLKELFDRFELTDRIVELKVEGINEYQDDGRCYDLVIAEGFIYTLENRDEVIGKLASRLSPGGIGVISFNDRCGGFIEIVKRFLFGRARELENIHNPQGEESFTLARRFFEADYSRINASRPFRAWWQDVLLNPLMNAEFLWSYEEILPLIEQCGCVVYSTSPKWTSADAFSWYKNVSDPQDLHRRFLDNWKQMFAYFLTGRYSPQQNLTPVSDRIVQSVLELMERISTYLQDLRWPRGGIQYPSELGRFLLASGEAELMTLDRELQDLFHTANNSNADELVTAYQDSRLVRSLWGVPYHYISFIRRN